jgi:hypothetical protein
MVPILNTWAFVGDEEKLRQEIEIPLSSLQPVCT